MASHYAFGPFEFFPSRALLLRNGAPVPMGSRALATLTILVANAGQYVSNEEIMRAVWPNTHVEDNNVRVQVGSLRRILEDSGTTLRYISNAPGRGYAFTAPFIEGARNQLSSVASAPLPTDQFPVLLNRLIGREAEVGEILERLSERRLLTITGPGGIGKTSVAITVALRLQAEHGRKIIFVDLAPLSSGAHLPSAIALALKLERVDDGQHLRDVITALQASPALLILDNCEHLLDDTATATQHLLRALPDLGVLTTSREPIRAEGEAIFRLSGLAAPQDAETADIEGVMAFAAVELFVDRACAASDRFRLAPGHIADIIKICRQLDGIPLAIELAAARVDVLGVGDLAERLSNRFALLTQGRRGALPRHRTLRATLEWSVESLSADELTVFARLSAFKSAFSIDAAALVVSDGEDFKPDAVTDILSSLIAKSLMVADFSGAAIKYRLLETTRAFADELLIARPDAAAVIRRHAEFLCDLFAKPEDQGAATLADWMETYGSRVDDVRAALKWAFSPNGDPTLGARLAMDSGPMWLRLSLASEYIAGLELAVERLSVLPDKDPRPWMWLYPRLHNAITNTHGPTRVRDVLLKESFELGREHQDIACQLAALWGLFGQRILLSDPSGAVEFATRFLEIAEAADNRDYIAMGHRVMCLSHMRAGDLDTAHRHGSHSVNALALLRGDALNSSFFYRHDITARANFINVLWLTGRPGQALAWSRDVIEQAAPRQDDASLCYVLSQSTIPAAFWAGDLDLAEFHIELMEERARKNAFSWYITWARAYGAVLTNLREHSTARLLFSAIDWSALSPLAQDILATLHDDLADREALDRAQTLRHWAAAEVMRRRAMRLIDNDDAIAAEDLLQQALQLARGQGALAWELRVATSLAELWRDQGRADEGAKLLECVVARFEEGHDLHDIAHAVGLIRSLAQ